MNLIPDSPGWCIFPGWPPPRNGLAVNLVQDMFRKYVPIRIETTPQGLSSDSPEVAGRLARIEENYRQLDELLGVVESRLPAPAKSAAEPGMALGGDDSGMEAEPVRGPHSGSRRRFPSRKPR